MSTLTPMMSTANHVAIDVETLGIDHGCSLSKEINELIYTIPNGIILNCQSS